MLTNASHSVHRMQNFWYWRVFIIYQHFQASAFGRLKVIWVNYDNVPVSVAFEVIHVKSQDVCHAMGEHRGDQAGIISLCPRHANDARQRAPFSVSKTRSTAFVAAGYMAWAGSLLRSQIFVSASQSIILLSRYSRA